MILTDEQEKQIKLAIAGDSQAFSTLVEETYDIIYAIAYKWTINKEDAEDIAQEVCIKLARSIQTFRMESQFSTWLYRITLNMVRDFQKKQKNKNLFKDISEENIKSQVNPHIQAEQQELWTYVQKLPENQKNAILLVYAQGLTHREASEIMDCKEATVSWYIHEAKKQLKLMVKNDEKI